MTRSFTFVRRGAGAAAVLALATATATHAAADPVTATVLEDITPGLNVNVGDGGFADLTTGLIGLRLSDGSTLGVYCVEIRTGIDAGQPMVEQDWADFPDASSPFNANQAGINWVLHNGFPVVDADELTTRLTDDGVQLNDGLSTEEAIAGTQAAIWHLSDAVDLNRENPVPGQEAAGQDVLALYDHLTGLDNVGIEEQPAASLEFEPDKRSGAAGERVGPFTVRTNGDIEKFTADVPDGVTVVDDDGAELNAENVEDGTLLFFDVAAGTADGSATVELTATARVETGRLFVGQNYGEGEKTQSLIVAESDTSRLTASATGEWSATPNENAVADENQPAPQAKNTSDLAETGASILVPGLVGLVLVGAGIGALLVLRKRRHT